MSNFIYLYKNNQDYLNWLENILEQTRRSKPVTAIAYGEAVMGKSLISSYFAQQNGYLKETKTVPVVYYKCEYFNTLKSIFFD